MTEILFATTKDIPKLLPTLIELRTNRTVQELENLLHQQFKEGFQIAYIGDDKMAYAVMGFRTLTMLHSGKTLYIDDLVTHPQYRQKGYAKKLLEWIKNYAKKNEYETLSLDSGFQRKEAYKLYLNFGFEISSMHFARAVKE